MTIEITQHLQAQSLLSMRWSQLQAGKLLDGFLLEEEEDPGDDPGEITYRIEESDPIPLGMRAGQYLYGSVIDTKAGQEGCLPEKKFMLPVLKSTGS